MAALSENMKVSNTLYRICFIFHVLQAAIPHFFTRGLNSLKLLQIKGSDGFPIPLSTGFSKFRGRGVVSLVYSWV